MLTGVLLLFPAVVWCQSPAGAPAQTAPAAPTAASLIADALRTLTRLRSPSELYIYGAARPNRLDVVAEIPAARVTGDRWVHGAEAEVTVTGPNGEAVGTVSGRVLPASRGVLLAVPIAVQSPGPWRVDVTVSAGSERLEDRATVEAGKPMPLLGTPVLYRAGSVPRAPIHPVADFQFRRTERVHVEWPMLKPIDQRVARLLGQAGQPLAVSTTVADTPGGSLAVDVNLAPLGPADYVLELVAASGRERERRLMAIRIVQ